MYLVTEIHPYKSKIKVIFNYKTTFLLYKSELKKYGIAPSEEISEDVYKEILLTLKKRAKERALYLIKDSDKTEKQIRDKLKIGFYPEEVINYVVQFLCKYDYLNDFRYAASYIKMKSKVKSKKQLQIDMMQKGISREIIKEIFEKNNFSNKESLDNIINKRINRYDFKDEQQLQKFYQYLFRKGFGYDEIKSAVRQKICECEN